MADGRFGTLWELRASPEARRVKNNAIGREHEPAESYEGIVSTSMHDQLYRPALRAESVANFLREPRSRGPCVRYERVMSNVAPALRFHAESTRAWWVSRTLPLNTALRVGYPLTCSRTREASVRSATGVVQLRGRRDGNGEATHVSAAAGILLRSAVHLRRTGRRGVTVGMGAGTGLFL